MSNKFICPNCGNEDEKYIGYKNGEPYCRLCLTFNGKKADYRENRLKFSKAFLSYELSNDQKILSNQLLENYKLGYNSLVHAICGSGKTEIVVATIEYAISVGYKVGFAVPRKDVANELRQRFSEIFKNNTVTLVVGGHTSKLYGDLVVLTTHQLFRYDYYFDLLILDEIDAFPYKGNYALNRFFDKAVKRNHILLSATPDEAFIENFKYRGGKIVTLYTRFHRYPLPVPSYKIGLLPVRYFFLVILIRKFIKEDKQVFIFTPTIYLCEVVNKFLSVFFIGRGTCVHSKKMNRNQIIEDFRNKKYSFLVTTAVLERGITVKNLQVIVFESDSAIYDRYSLVQIAGRAGRKADAPTGEVYYVASKVTKEMEASISDIKTANKDLQNMLSTNRKT